MSSLLEFPLGFWISLALLFGVAANAWRHRNEAWGIPAIAVCGTVFTWYHGDVLYNNYAQYAAQFAPDTIIAAWWQVTAFVVSFAILAPFVHKQFNPARVGRHSTALIFANAPDALDKLSRQLASTLRALAVVWIVLSIFA